MFEGVLNTPLEYEGRKQDALHKLTKFHLLSRCGKSVETPVETLRFHKILTQAN